MPRQTPTSMAQVKIWATRLNPGDEFTLLALVSSFSGEIRVDGRVVGVTNIERKRPDVRSKYSSLAAMAVGGALTLIPSSILPAFHLGREQFFAKVEWLGVILPVAVILFSKALRTKRTETQGYSPQAFVQSVWIATTYGRSLRTH
jgi:hypothetical protein